MTENHQELTLLQQQKQRRNELEQTATRLFAPEDDALTQALVAAQTAGLPTIQVNPLEGKFLQFLALVCNAHRILEIGSLAGYSGIWLARALPAGGKLITLELDPQHAEVVRANFANAELADRTEVRVGKALDLLPQLSSEEPFDLVFIDADKGAYPDYLDWALRLSRPGSIIIADNTIRGIGCLTGKGEGDAIQGPYRYNQKILQHPRLTALALPMDEDYMDGFTIAVVQR